MITRKNHLKTQYSSSLKPQSLVTWCRVVYTRIVSINVHLSDNDRTLPTVWPILARYEPRYSPEMGRETRRKLKLNLITGGLFPPRGCRATFIGQLAKSSTEGCNNFPSNPHLRTHSHTHTHTHTQPIFVRETKVLSHGSSSLCCVNCRCGCL